MGFHKRWINEDLLLGHYRSGGIKRVVDLWGADAIITSDELSHNISDLLFSEHLTREEGLEKAEHMVHMAMLEKGINETKDKKTSITG